VGRKISPLEFFALFSELEFQGEILHSGVVINAYMILVLTALNYQRLS